MSNRKHVIKVIYCGGWGYRPRYEAVKRAIDQKFPGRFDVIGEATPTTTGALEVDLTTSSGPKNLHSKLRGQGYIDAKKMEQILAELDNFLKQQ